MAGAGVKLYKIRRRPCIYIYIYIYIFVSKGVVLSVCSRLFELSPKEASIDSSVEHRPSTKHELLPTTLYTYIYTYTYIHSSYR